MHELPPLQITQSGQAVAEQLQKANQRVEAEITRRVAAGAALRDSQERYALTAAASNDGLFDWNLATGEINYSERWKEILGCATACVTASPSEWFWRVHPDDLAGLQAAVAAHWDGSAPRFQFEHRMRHADGRWLWILSRGLASRTAGIKAMRMAGCMTDISAFKEAQERLVRGAFHDSVTGLPNRALFMERLDKAVTKGQDEPHSRYAVLFLDMDRFKLVNDSLGHVAGDQLLVAFATRLSACLRPGDTLARVGGDEFTILLGDVSCEEDAMRVAQRALDSLKSPFHVSASAGLKSGGSEVFVTASIGIALGGGGDAQPQDLLRDADTALYRAKALGKNRHQLFDSAMHQHAVALLQMENDLRRAVERDEFELHFQPIIQIASERVTAFEALIRWRHPERGLVMPADFIPIAEENGIITVIGQWVLRQACRQAAKWRLQFPGAGDVGVAVNLSAKQFAEPHLCEQVQAALEQSGLPPRCLILEITESVVMADAEQSAVVMQRLKALGVKMDIDDFGTGYSSLAYLHNFPVDTMKIDRSFIARLDGKAENAEIVRTIVTLAHTLNMTVTAEGVETETQLAHLRGMSCENSQGYLLSRPLPAAGATRLLESHMTLPIWRPLRASA